MITKAHDEINKLVINYKLIESDIKEKCISEIIKLIKEHTTFNIFNLSENGINITLNNGEIVESVEYHDTEFGKLWIYTSNGVVSNIDEDINGMEYYDIFTEMTNYFQ